MKPTAINLEVVCKISREVTPWLLLTAFDIASCKNAFWPCINFAPYSVFAKPSVEYEYAVANN